MDGADRNHERRSKNIGTRSLKGIATRSTGTQDLGWLTEVQEAAHPITDQSPIRMRYGVVRSGPPIPAPERHPFCQMSMLRGGRGIQYVEGEQAEIQPGDIFLIGPNVPHTHQITHYPHRFVTVYFPPSLFIGPGRGQDGLRLLRRIVAHRPLSRRLIRPPANLRRQTVRHLDEMIAEWESPAFGSQLRLQAILDQILVELIRWEDRQGIGPPEAASTVDTMPLDAALHHIREHYHQPIYLHDLARAAGLDETALNGMFRDVLRVTWVQYLQGYRVRQASLLLSAGTHNVTEAALSAGFESLSHFNATFRRILGVSPRQFLARHPPANQQQ